MKQKNRFPPRTGNNSAKRHEHYASPIHFSLSLFLCIKIKELLWCERYGVWHKQKKNKEEENCRADKQTNHLGHEFLATDWPIIWNESKVTSQNKQQFCENERERAIIAIENGTCTEHVSMSKIKMSKSFVLQSGIIDYIEQEFRIPIVVVRLHLTLEHEWDKAKKKKKDSQLFENGCATFRTSIINHMRLHLVTSLHIHDDDRNPL